MTSHRPFLIRPEQILTLPHLHYREKEVFFDSAHSCWDAIEKPYGRRRKLDPLAAQQRLTDLTQFLRNGFRTYQNYQLQMMGIGNELSRLNLADLPGHQKKEGDDWHAVFYPQVLRVLDIQYLKTIRHGELALDLMFSPDGKFIATASHSSGAQVFDVSSGFRVCSLPPPSSDIRGLKGSYVSAVCFSPDGVWECSTKKLKQRYETHEADIHSVAFSPDDKYVISGGPDNTIKMWSLEDGAGIDNDSRLRMFKGHAFPVFSATFTPDGAWIISGFYDGRVQF